MARVLGIDCSLRSTGLGVVEAQGSRLSAVAMDTLRVPASRSRTTCLATISRGVADMLDRTQPDCVSIESAFYHKNAKTAEILGQARGAAIAVCACRDLPVFEYEPRRVKQACVGYGAATKTQVGKMVMRLLGLDAMPQEDACDALSLAICHLQSCSGVAQLMREPI